MSEVYLLDSNCFIAPARTFYGYDFAPSFWKQLRSVLVRPDVLVIREVHDEIMKDEEIGSWMREINEYRPFSTKTGNVVMSYAKVQQYVSECKFYTQAGIIAWAKRTVADPWLIAAALTMEGAWVVTQEQSVGTLSPKSPTGKVKIPDVADHFQVPCMNLFSFMRRMHFRL